MTDSASQVAPAVAPDSAAGADGAPEARATALGWWQWLSFTCVRGCLRVHLAVWGLGGLEVGCRFFGTLEYAINYKRRRRVRKMLRKVLGEEVSAAELRRRSRAHFVRQRCDKAFYLVCDMLSTEAIRARFEIVNGELLDAGLARGKGVYALLSHHGPHHITGLTMSLMGYRVAGIRDPNEGPLRTYIQSLWTKRHTELTPAKVLYTTDFVRGIYRLLRDNYALGSALDVSRVRDERLKTMPVRIYGEQREFLTGTLQIALRCRAAIVQAFIVAEDGFRYRLEFLGPMADPDRDSESDALLGDVLQRYADNIAAYARRYPEQITRV
jgi:lauroyl/myristoyl acyltransferase